MNVEEFRAINAQPGMKFRLNATGAVGEVESVFKDSVVLCVFNLSKKKPSRTFCPCQMISVYDGTEFVKEKKTNKHPQVLICQNCGKPFSSSYGWTKYCCEECKKEAAKKRYVHDDECGRVYVRKRDRA